MHRPLRLALVPLLAIACTEPAADGPTPGEGEGEGEGEAGEGEGEGRCTDGNTRPATPALVSPVDGATGVLPAALVLTAGAYEDAEGDLHRATRFEILRQKSDGLELAWEFESYDPARLKDARLEDGAFVSDDGQLLEDEDYVARVAFRDDSSACNDWSITSDDVRFHTDDGSAFLFDEDQILTFEIDIPPESMALINAQAPSPGCIQYLREFYSGTLRFQGQVFEGVGVRTKGGCGSSRTLDGKASLKVDLSWDDPNLEGCPAERRLFGQKTLTFNNGVQDRSASHERLGYELYSAAGVPVPRAATVQLVVNGEPWGVFTNVETFSRRMLGRFYENNDGMMYEGAYACDLVPQNVPVGDEFSCFALEFEPDVCSTPSPGADAEDWELLRTLTNQLQPIVQGESFYPEIEARFDMDEFLSMWAVDAAIAHWDAYSFTIVNNYRVYHDPSTDRWSMFPWGIDQTFNGGGDVDPFGSSALLVNECIGDAECLAAFAQRLDEVTVLFESLDLGARAQAIHDQLQPFVYADPRKEYSNDEWEDQHAELQSWIAERPARLRAYVDSVR